MWFHLMPSWFVRTVIVQQFSVVWNPLSFNAGSYESMTAPDTAAQKSTVSAQKSTMSAQESTMSSNDEAGSSDTSENGTTKTDMSGSGVTADNTAGNGGGGQGASLGRGRDVATVWSNDSAAGSGALQDSAGIAGTDESGGDAMVAPDS